jgi:hypothetical protein
MRKPSEKKDSRDLAYQVGKGVLSAIPIAGGALSVVYESIFSAPIELRKQEWLNELADAVLEIQDYVDDLTPEKLAEDPAFITVALQASQIALRNHQKEKLDALRNAVINSALPSAPEENLRIVFLRLIDQYTEWHIRILCYLDDPVVVAQRRQSLPNNPKEALGFCFPELNERKDFTDFIIRELQADGLIKDPTSQSSTSGQDHDGVNMKTEFVSCATQLGKEFISFVSAKKRSKSNEPIERTR